MPKCGYNQFRCLSPRIIFLSLLSLLVSGLQAQELTVKRMEVAPMDLSACTQPRNDLNGNACALVKVLMVDGIDRVEGNVIGEVEDRGYNYAAEFGADYMGFRLAFP